VLPQFWPIRSQEIVWMLRAHEHQMPIEPFALRLNCFRFIFEMRRPKLIRESIIGINDLDVGLAHFLV
jgi:hypothetical protein